MPSDRSIVRLKFGACFVLTGCVAVLVARTMHWPLVNDASLMHYMSFLIDKGKAPYRDFGDMNLPGSLLIDWLTVHAIGGGALSWRIFDLGLMVVGGAAIGLIARPFGWFAGVFGACLLLLFHGRDGMAQLGQRDLQMAVSLLVAYACLFYALRTKLIWPMFLFGMAAGVAATIGANNPSICRRFAGDGCVCLESALPERDTKARRCRCGSVRAFAACVPLAMEASRNAGVLALDALRYAVLRQPKPPQCRLSRQGFHVAIDDSAGPDRRRHLVEAARLANG